MLTSPTQGALPFSSDAAAEAAAAHGLADTLRRRAMPPDAGVWDEMRGPDGELRPAWRRFADAWPGPDSDGEPAALSPAAVGAQGGQGTGAAPGGLRRRPPDIAADLDRRVGQVAQQLQRDGVTHNVFNDQGVASRPWSLELLPLIIQPAEWARIEAGVVQRAGLLQAIYADVNGQGPGSQRLLHEGLLPPALLLRHPGYVRAMQGVRPPGGLALHMVAFDLARGPDGQWWVVQQRTQGPSGLGYVLHNRLVVARQFPEAFRDLRVQHIASSYRRLLNTVEALASEVAGGGTPRVVLLTPGAYSETYFEHAYLARYLGLPLVEGGDLTVRGQQLFLKTVEGLEPVHGVLRRLDDDWCDPLELRADSSLGVPGLLQAARAGTVVMANALGSAFLESPALQGFLPGIAQRLTGEALHLPGLPTWWCGEAAAWGDACQHLRSSVVRRTFPHEGRTSQVNAGLARGDAAALAEIEADPDAWTVQGRLRFSRAPIWGQGSVLPRPAMVRVYAIAEGDGRWHVLPGGMTRVAQREDGSVSMQRGGSSLDTWVLTDGPVDTFSMLPKPLQVDDIAQRRRPVSSRTGENLFWLGRYTERTEQMVRLARATLNLLDTDTDMTEPVQRALSFLVVKRGMAPEGVPSLLQAPHLFERALLASLSNAQGEGGTTGIAFNLAALERSAQGLRDRLSAEHWALISRMVEGFSGGLADAPGGVPSLPQALLALDQLALQLAAVTGAQTDRMTRDHGWRLLTVGRLIERLNGLTLRLSAFLDARALGSASGIELLLELFDSTMTFRARYQRHDDLLALTDLLVLDTSNPRAYAGILRRLRTELGKLPGTAESLQPLLDRLPAQGPGLNLDMLRGLDEAGLMGRLKALSQQLSQAALDLADDVSSRYFTLAQGVDQSV